MTFYELRTEHERFFWKNNRQILKTCRNRQRYTVDITDNGSAGDGIARIQGFIIFVKNTKAGDKNVKIKISSLKDRFATAEIAAGSTDTT